LVHHGLFWKNTPQPIDAPMRDRLKLLFDHDINLVGFHLPLDAHVTYGNNARICDELGLTRLDTPFAVMGGHSIGCIGTYDDALDHAAFTSRLQQVVGGRPPLALGVTDRPIRTVAICSGGAANELAAAAAAGADAFITGEPNEPAHATARELGISFLAAGHHATETFGVRALGNHLADHFGVRVTHLDADNPV
ncbi:MAG: Nif3-like dinuclear metal center hexameric protein, partial [Thermoleophilia bacterium]|nr:Nif3-like dinuclear metal center hexameric protein [Thermoleophilia bacterium]